MQNASSKPSTLDLFFSPKQLLSLKESDAKINIWEGAVRSGKTYVSLWRFLKEIKNGPEGQYVVLAKTIGAFKRNVYEQLDKLIGTDVHWYVGKQEMFIWGRQIHVIGCSDERAESRIKGPTFFGAYVDEATEIPEGAFKMLVSRCAMGGAKIFATTNPDTPFHYLNTEYLQNNSDVKQWKFFLEDNPQLTEEERAYLKRQYRGLWHKRFILAEWCLAEGSIFDFFDEAKHTAASAPCYSQYYIAGIDYGTVNATAFILIGVNEDINNPHPPLWVEREYYFDSRKAGFQKTAIEYADDFIDFASDYPIKTVYLDPSAAAFKLELKRKLKMVGSPTMVTDEVNNDVYNGICALSVHLAAGNLLINQRCQNLIKEIQSYVWDSKKAERGKEAPVKTLDHCLDGLRYATYTRFGKNVEIKKMTQDQKEFETWKKTQRMNSPWAPPPPQQRGLNVIRRR